MEIVCDLKENKFMDRNKGSWRYYRTYAKLFCRKDI